MKIEISQLSSKERLEMMEALWDTLIHEVEKPASPAWHEDVLKQRQQSIEDGSAEYISMDEWEESISITEEGK